MNEILMWSGRICIKFSYKFVYGQYHLSKITKTRNIVRLEMTIFKPKPMMLVALLAGLLATNQVFASCGSSQRVDYDDSWCLAADLDSNNGNFLRTSRWTLQNQCDFNMRAKVDLRSSPDVSYDIGPNSSSSGSSRAAIRNAVCCKDHTDSLNGINGCTFESGTAYRNALAAENSDDD